MAASAVDAEADEAFACMYNIRPEEVARVLEQHLLDALARDASGTSARQLLADLVPKRRWFDLFACDMSDDGLLVRGAHELPPVSNLASEITMARALWRACRLVCHGNLPATAARCAMLISNVSWFPARQRAVDWAAALAATNKRKAHEVRRATAEYQRAHNAAARDVVVQRQVYWLQVALQARDTSRLRLWSRVDENKVK
jgi:hypothetical protein